MMRWSSLASRLAMLLLIAAAVVIGRDVLIKNRLIQAGQTLVGGKVDIGLVRSGWANTTVRIAKLSIANPRHPKTNLLQAESAELQFDRKALLKRQLVINDGRLSGVIFGAPRSHSGLIEGTPNLHPANDPRTLVSEVASGTDLIVAREQWEVALQTRKRRLDDESLRLNQVSREIVDRWETDLQTGRATLDSLSGSLAEIIDSLSGDFNPLRDSRMMLARGTMDQINAGAGELLARIERMRSRLTEDRELMVQAKADDLADIVAAAAPAMIEGRLISQLLLARHQQQQSQQILDWFNYFQAMVPDPDCDFCTVQRPGVDVPLPGKKNVPGLLINNVQLEGTGRFAGAKFSFSGNAANLSTDPELVDPPVEIQLRAQGNAHALLHCVLDRTAGQRSDRVEIRCSDLPQPALVLGDDETIRVRVSPSRCQVLVNLDYDGESVDGTIEFDHSNLVMQIEQLDEEAGGRELADRINLGLASVSTYRVQAKVRGSIHHPIVTFESDLGDQLAERINAARRPANNELAGELEQLLRQRLEIIDSQIEPAVDRIAEAVRNELLPQQARVASSLETRLPSSPAERPTHR